MSLGNAVTHFPGSPFVITTAVVNEKGRLETCPYALLSGAVFCILSWNSGFRRKDKVGVMWVGFGLA